MKFSLSLIGVSLLLLTCNLNLPTTSKPVTVKPMPTVAASPTIASPTPTPTPAISPTPSTCPCQTAIGASYMGNDPGVIANEQAEGLTVNVSTGCFLGPDGMTNCSADATYKFAEQNCDSAHTQNCGGRDCSDGTPPIWTGSPVPEGANPNGQFIGWNVAWRGVPGSNYSETVCAAKPYLDTYGVKTCGSGGCKTLSGTF